MSNENNTEVTEGTETKKRSQKLKKAVDYDNGTVTIEVISIGKSLECELSKLPDDIMEKLPVLAISHRIGDSAAGKDGDEALAAMTRVWDGLVSGNWQVKAEPGERMSKAKAQAAIDRIQDPKKKALAQELFKDMGLNID